MGFCAPYSLTEFRRDGQQIWWHLNNGDTGSDIEIKELVIDWPNSLDELVKIELDGNAIYDRVDHSPPTYGETWEWKEGEDRTVSSGGSKHLTFQFGKNALPTGYNLEVTLQCGCVLTANQ